MNTFVLAESRSHQLTTSTAALLSTQHATLQREAMMLQLAACLLAAASWGGAAAADAAMPTWVGGPRPDPLKPHAGLKVLPRTARTTIYNITTPSGGNNTDGVYNLGPMLMWWPNASRFVASWYNGPVRESVGNRVVLSFSEDGLVWTAPRTVFPAVNAKGEENEPFANVNGRLYATASDVSLGNVHDSGIRGGLLMRELSWKAAAVQLGEIFWVGDPGPGVDPAYKYKDYSAMGEPAKSDAAQYLASLVNETVARGAGGMRFNERSFYALPGKPKELVLLLREGGKKDTAERKGKAALWASRCTLNRTDEFPPRPEDAQTFSCRSGTGAYEYEQPNRRRLSAAAAGEKGAATQCDWSQPKLTNIPDAPSRACAGHLPGGGGIGLLGNQGGGGGPCGNRNPLTFLTSQDGLSFDAHWAVESSAPEPRWPSLKHTRGYNYPSFMWCRGDGCGGKLKDSIMFSYSVSKEDIVITVAKLSSMHLKADDGEARPSLTMDGSCASELDCQLNGECVDGKCVCDAAWSGNANCSTLAFLPAKMANGCGKPGSPTSSWGAGVVQDPKTKLWIMAVSDYALSCGQGALAPNQQCGLAVSTTPGGPYTKNRTLIDPYCEGSSIARDPLSGRWLYLHGGDGGGRTAHGIGCWNCEGSEGITPYSVQLSFDRQNMSTPRVQCPHTPGNRDKINGSSDGYALVSVTTDPLGAWESAPRVKCGSNNEPVISRNGTLFVMPPGRVPLTPAAQARCGANAFGGMYRADSLEKAIASGMQGMQVRYAIAGIDPSSFRTESDLCFNWEDQTIWLDKRDHFHSIAHAYRGAPNDLPICDRWSSAAAFMNCTAIGGHAYSENGADWYISPVPAYTPRVEYEDGSVLILRARERPHVIIDPVSGDLTHLINGAADPCPKGVNCLNLCDKPWHLNGKNVSYPCGGNCDGFGQPLCESIPNPMPACGRNVGCPGADHSFTLIQPLKLKNDDSANVADPIYHFWPTTSQSQDPSGVLQTADGWWHVFPDCAGAPYNFSH